MRTFILSYSRDNYDVAREVGVIGFPTREKKALALLAPGDRVLFYVSKETVKSTGGKEAVQRFLGSAEVVGDYYLDDKTIFKIRDGEIYPHRYKIKMVRADLDVPIKAIYEDLSFVTNTLYWGLPLRKGWALGDDNDWRLVHAYRG